MNRAPVFIGGAGRSGTTLVVDLLGLHPDISPIYETSFVIKLLNLLLAPERSDERTLQQVAAEMDRWTALLPFRPHAKRDHERYFHGPHYILFERSFAMERTKRLVETIRAGHPAAEEFAAFVLDLFDEHVRRDGDGTKSRWVNKTPLYVLHLEKLRMVFPDLKFIHCVRDGRDAVASAMTLPWGPKTIEEAARWWIPKVSAGMRFARVHPAQYLEVKYEALIRSPEQELRHMLNWLGETDRTDHILSLYKDGPIAIHISGADGSTRLSKEDAAAFTQLAAGVLRGLGYC